MKNAVFVTKHTSFPLPYPTNSWYLLSNQLLSPGELHTRDDNLEGFLTTESLFVTENYFGGYTVSGQKERNPARSPGRDCSCGSWSFSSEGVVQDRAGWRRRAGEGEGAQQGTAVKPLLLL